MIKEHTMKTWKVKQILQYRATFLFHTTTCWGFYSKFCAELSDRLFSSFQFNGMTRTNGKGNSFFKFLRNLTFHFLHEWPLLGKNCFYPVIIGYLSFLFKKNFCLSLD